MLSFASLMKTSFLLASAALVSAAPSTYPAGVIVAPANGTAIAPGQAFDFTYNAHGDYCISSYNYSVWLLTEKPSGFAPSENFASGYFFGTFDEANYPAVPYAQNPAPAQLTMPDFSQNQGGFGAGQNASDVTVYVMVWEEWAQCEGALGKRISLALNNVIYNATSST